MKKIMFPLLALIVAVSLSAFTHQKSPSEKASTSTMEYYFFEVVNGQVNTSAPLNDEPLTVEEFDNPIDCPSGNNADCIRAWEVGHTPTATGAGDYTIRKL
jgi:hypothetical protein